MFIKWTAIWAVSAALERRVFTITARSALFPNLFVLLVSPPGVGKSAILEPTLDMMHATRKLKLAPDDVTNASLIDALAASAQIKQYGTEVWEYASLATCAPEFGVFMSSHDLKFMSTLSVLFDNKKIFTETRRTRDEQIEIHNPSMTLLAGTQPAFLQSFLPEEAWGQGFMARVIMVYSGTFTPVPLFGNLGKINHKELQKSYERLCDIHGEMKWTRGAQERIELWYNGGCQPIPQNSRLANYNTRRILHCLKLSMISAVARTQRLVIEEFDVERAINWLLDAEVTMGDVFREMAGKSDVTILRDLQTLCIQYYAQENKPINEVKIRAFLSSKTPAHNVNALFNLCLQLRILKRVTKNGQDDITNTSPLLVPAGGNPWSMD